MQLAALPTLEDLRSATFGAWLWDGARGRVVWANAVGLAMFDCTSIFDLIDRPFDQQEAGVLAIAAQTQSLARGEQAYISLEFPSLGHAKPIACMCNLHSLADGRPGLLVVETQGKAGSPEANSVLNAFQHMPLAAAFISKTGQISGSNESADLLFSATAMKDLLGSTERAAALLRRLENAGLVSSIEAIVGRVGPREVRLTLQKLGELSAAYGFVMLDDVTERRNLERQMTPASTPALAPVVRPISDDSTAFEELARSLKDTIQKDSLAVEPKTKKQTEKISVQSVPHVLAKALDQSRAAIAIQKDGRPAYVSKSAVQLFGCANEEQLLNDGVFWHSLSVLRGNQPEAKVTVSQSHTLELGVKVATIAWFSGPAVQYVFEDRKAVETAKAPALETVAASTPEKMLPVAVEIFQPSSAAALPDAAIDDDLKRILDIASDGIVTLDRDGKILSFSAGAEAIFGYRIAEVLERPLVELLSADSRKLFRDYLSGLEGPGLAAVFNDGREMTAIVKQGGSVPIFFTLGRLQSSQTRAAYAVVMRDITSWKRTEKELRTEKDAAEEASRQKSEFLARISHELRTPLNAIIGFSEVMRLGQFGELKNEKYRGYVNDIYSSGSYLLSLINDLLDLSKIEAGKMELNFTAVSVVDATDHAVRLLQDTATRGRVVVRRSFAEKLPRVVADLRALRQVMVNVLSNAIKFTDPGGQVIVSAQVNEKGELTLSIKDTGIGMNAAQIKDALEPFKRVETVGRETQGTGLGLSLTKALVEANRAKFDISSETGHGTLIEIVFPTTRVLAE